MTIALVIEGAPRTKKTSNRIFKVGRFTKVMPSARFMEWQEAAKVQLWQQRTRDHGPVTEPVQVAATFYREANRGDLIGYMQALADCLETCGVLENDRLIVSWDGTRMTKDARRPRVELTVSTFHEVT